MAGVIGLGFVGSAVTKSFGLKGVSPLYGYDKFKDGGIGSLEECLRAPIVFFCLPTPYDDGLQAYDKSAIEETLAVLEERSYNGIIVLKSTVEPGTTEIYSERYPSLSIIHNPEFLTAATAFEDFHAQKHIVIGKGSNCNAFQVETVSTFFQSLYPDAEISICSSDESESMKSFVNCFYSVKIQFFNELYLSCKNLHVDYNTVRDLMLKNGWINPMHTKVPGTDGKLSYGGMCFPKDTNALLHHMKRQGTPHAVLEGTVTERNKMRDDNVNCVSKKASKHGKNTNEYMNGNGYIIAPKNGYTNGHSNGHSNGHTNGYTNGYTNGHANGHTNGHINGHKNGFTNGHVNGHINGHTNGYSNGHTNGQLDTQMDMSVH